jgi:hypothetical protein
MARSRVRLLSLAGILGVAVAAAIATPGPVKADTGSYSFSGADLHTRFSPSFFTDTYGIGITPGCGVPGWDSVYSGWASYPSHCQSSDTLANFVGDHFHMGTLRLTAELPPGMVLDSMTIYVRLTSHELYGPSFPPYWFYMLTSGVAVEMFHGNPSGDAVTSFPNITTGVAGVITQFDMLVVAADDIEITDIDLTWHDYGSCGSGGSCITGGGGGAPVTAAQFCAACTYTPTGNIINDAPALIDYLYCGLSSIYFCWLNQTLALIFRYILYILIVIQSFIIWLIAQGGAVITWASTGALSGLFWLGGIVQNSANHITEAIYFSGGRATVIVEGTSSNLFDVLIAFINTVGHVFGDISENIRVIVTQMQETVRTIITGFFGVLFGLINGFFAIIAILIQVAGVIVIALIDLLEIIVETIGAVALGLINGVLSGFSAPVTDPLAQINALSGSSVSSISSLSGACANNVVVHLCIGEYILDNTIFSASSPVTYGFFIVVGLIWLDRLLWALNKLRTVAK